MVIASADSAVSRAMKLGPDLQVVHHLFASMRIYLYYVHNLCWSKSILVHILGIETTYVLL